MNILAFDTATNYESIALAKNGTIVAEITKANTRDHSKNLLPNINKMLENTDTDMTDLDVITVAIGPGSFTGIRISLSTAKGISFGLKIPLLALSSLESLANNAMPVNHQVASIMDAGRGEIYFSLYSFELQQIVEPNLTTIKQAVENIDEKTLIAGYFSDKTEKRLETEANFSLNFCAKEDRIPKAASLIDLITKKKTNYKYKFKEISKIKPLYLRRSAAEEKFNKK